MKGTPTIECPECSGLGKVNYITMSDMSYNLEVCRLCNGKCEIPARREIILSVNPEWVSKIISGEKTIEVRKSAPRQEGHYKVFIYETKANGGRGKVVASFNTVFLCYDHVMFMYTQTDLKTPIEKSILKRSCLTEEQILEYGKGKDRLFFWHIWDLKVFRKECDLEDWGVNRAPQSWMYVKEAE